MADRTIEPEGTSGLSAIVVKPPRQSRSWDSYERVLTAVEELLEEYSFDDLTLTQILKASGVSNGSFYARFGNKQTVLKSLYLRFCEDLQQRIGQLVNDESKLNLRGRVKRIVRAQVNRMKARRGLLRTLAIDRRQNPHGVAAKEWSVIRESLKAVEDYMMNCAEEMNHQNPRKAIRFALFVLSGICRDRFLFPETPHAQFLRMSEQNLVESLEQMLYGYLHQ